MLSIKAPWRRETTENEISLKSAAEAPAERGSQAQPTDLDIAPNDPLLAYLQNARGAVEIERLLLDSPALRELKENGVTLVMPLVSQGELIGLINLGGRLSEQEYSGDDRKLLGDLATQAAPALRVAQLVRQQQLAAPERERIEQELRVARLIQQTLLPQKNCRRWTRLEHHRPLPAGARRGRRLLRLHPIPRRQDRLYRCRRDRQGRARGPRDGHHAHPAARRQRAPRVAVGPSWNGPTTCWSRRSRRRCL